MLLSVQIEQRVTGWIPRAQRIGSSLVDPANWPRRFALTSLQRGQPTHRCIFRCTEPPRGPARRALYLFFFSSGTHWDGSRGHHQALDLYICHISLLINSKHLLARRRGVKSVSLPGGKRLRATELTRSSEPPRQTDGSTESPSRTLQHPDINERREQLMKCVYVLDWSWIKYRAEHITFHLLTCIYVDIFSLNTCSSCFLGFWFDSYMLILTYRGKNVKRV